MQTGTSASKTAAPVPRTASSVPVSHILDGADSGVKVTEHGSIDRVMWEAGILYGKGRIDEVRSVAKAAVEKGMKAGFLVQLALLRLDGNKQSFEDAAVEYAVQTGNSPPVWLDAHDIKDIPETKAPQKISIAIPALTSDGIIETTIKMENPWPLTLDFSGVTKTDVMGLDIFHQALNERIGRGEPTQLVGVDRVLRSIMPKIKDSSAQSTMSLWEFCLNCHRLTGDREHFNAMASDYADRFDASIPVWRDLSMHEEEKSTDATGANKLEPDGFVFVLKESVGELTVALAKDLFQKEDSAKSLRNTGKLIVDFVSVRRWSLDEMLRVIDFIRNVSKYKIGIEFHNVNEMLASLLAAFNVDKQVRLVMPGEGI